MGDPHFWQHRRVFITGATGILGSWLTRELLQLGAEVVALVRDWVPQSQLVATGTIDRLNVVRGDLLTPGLLERVYPEYEIDTAFHLAAITTVGIANRAPMVCYETNVRGTYMMLEAARQWPRLGRLLVASSDKAYGAHDTLPYTEDMALNGIHPYEVSKAATDILARSYAATYDMPVAVTRAVNMFGGGDLNWNRIIPGTVRSTWLGEAPVIRSDGTPLRDFLYVKDIVNAYITLAEAMQGGAHSGAAYNFGSAQPHSVLDVVQTIVRLGRHPELEPQVVGTASHEIQAQYLSSALAEEKLGWRPQYTFEEGLAETIDWYYRFLDAQS